MDIREKLVELLDHALEKFRFDAWENSDKIADHLIANNVTVQDKKEMVCLTTTDDFPNREDARAAGYYRRHYFCPACETRIGHQTFDGKRMFGQGTLLKGDEFPKYCPECGVWMHLPQPPKGE